MEGPTIEQLAIQQGAIGIVAEALMSTLLDIEDYEQRLPCVLICTDLDSGEQTFSGPFPTRGVGHRILQHEVACAGLDSMLTFTLAPLYPALELPETGGHDAAAPGRHPVLPTPRDA